MKQEKRISTKLLVLTSALTAMVVVLQLLGSFIRFGVFSISLVLIPIVIGAAICGSGVGAWLGLVFGVTVLISGDAAAFLVVDPVGTVVTVLVKGTLAGYLSGLTYKIVAGFCDSLKAKLNSSESANLEKARDFTLKHLPVLAAAIICPVVNTGVFLIGCNLFFYDTVSSWGSALGYESAAAYMLLGLAGGNFLFELLFNVILSPMIVRVLDIFMRKFQEKKSPFIR